MEKKTLTLAIPAELHADLRARARKLSANLDKDVSVSEIVRTAICELLAHPNLEKFFTSKKEP